MYDHDHDDALAYIAKRTGYPRLHIEAVLHAEIALFAALSIAQDVDIDAAAIKAKYPDIFHGAAAGVLDWELEATFIQLETRLAASVVVQIIAAEQEYMAALGIVDCEMVPAYRSWSAEWVGDGVRGTARTGHDSAPSDPN